jgi:hypothetical protein
MIINLKRVSMKKLYTKFIMIGLSIASISALGMMHTKATVRQEKRAKRQEQKINAYVEEIATNNQKKIEAQQQEMHISWYVAAISQNNIKTAQNNFTSTHT